VVQDGAGYSRRHLPRFHPGGDRRVGLGDRAGSQGQLDLIHRRLGAQSMGKGPLLGHRNRDSTARQMNTFLHLEARSTANMYLAQGLRKRQDLHLVLVVQLSRYHIRSSKLMTMWMQMSCTSSIFRPTSSLLTFQKE
jgi:hypothetical protein